jgi:hypothetical protein
MRKLLCTALIGLPMTIFAHGAPPTNLITMPLQSQMWVNSHSAKVIVNVDASVSNKGLGMLRRAVRGNLNKVVRGSWHITQFSRVQDSSGLEKVNVTAQVRVPDSQLSSVRAHAKALSQPGVKYRIADIQFTPSANQFSQTKTMLRAHIYQKAQAEIQQLNKTFAPQRFKLFKINFQSNYALHPPVAMAFVKRASNSAAAPMQVSNKVVMNATVSFRPMRSTPPRPPQGKR